MLYTALSIKSFFLIEMRCKSIGCPHWVCQSGGFFQGRIVLGCFFFCLDCYRNTQLRKEVDNKNKSVKLCPFQVTGLHYIEDLKVRRIRSLTLGTTQPGPGSKHLSSFTLARQKHEGRWESPGPTIGPARWSPSWKSDHLRCLNRGARSQPNGETGEGIPGRRRDFLSSEIARKEGSMWIQIRQNLQMGS